MASYRPAPNASPEQSLPGLPLQASLFAPALLPRQLPVYKAGPEDDFITHWASPPHPVSMH